MEKRLANRNSVEHHGNGVHRTVQCTQRCRPDYECAKRDKRESTYRPQTKHSNCKLHHFGELTNLGAISIQPIPTAEQPADQLTKSLSYEQTERLRRDDTRQSQTTNYMNSKIPSHKHGELISPHGCRRTIMGW